MRRFLKCISTLLFSRIQIEIYVGPLCLFLTLGFFSVAKVIIIFEKFQCYGVQIIDKYLFSSLPNLKVNISHDINLVLAPNV